MCSRISSSSPPHNVPYISFLCFLHVFQLGIETETFFDEDFWESLDCVVNALDNVEARLYVDSKCVDFARPLLESGTLGTKGNTQVCGRMDGGTDEISPMCVV